MQEGTESTLGCANTLYGSSRFTSHLALEGTESCRRARRSGPCFTSRPVLEAMERPGRTASRPSD
jgi:hypothetical protein